MGALSLPIWQPGCPALRAPVGTVASTQCPGRNDRPLTAATDRDSPKIPGDGQKEEPDRVEQPAIAEEDDRPVVPPVDLELDASEAKPTLEDICDLMTLEADVLDEEFLSWTEMSLTARVRPSHREPVSTPGRYLTWTPTKSRRATSANLDRLVRRIVGHDLPTSY